MSEEAKKTAPLRSEQPETAPEEKAQQAAPEQDLLPRLPTEGGQEEGRRLVQQEGPELEAVKAKLDAAERTLHRPRISCCAWLPSTTTTASAPPAKPTRSSATAFPLR